MKWKMGTWALVAGLFVGGVGKAATVTVTPSSLNGWAFYSTDSSGTVGTGSNTADIVGAAPAPGTAPLPPGAAHLQTAAGGGDGTAQARLTGLAGTRIDALTSLSYDTYASAWNGQQLPYLTIRVDLDGDTVTDDRLHFEPTYTAGSEALNTWQHWNALTGQWYSDSGIGTAGFGTTVTLAQYLGTAGYANARIVEDEDQSIGGIRFASGFASDTDNFNAYFDNVTIGTAGGTKTYDFEAAVVPLPPTVWMGMTLISGMVGYSLYKRHLLKAELA